MLRDDHADVMCSQSMNQNGKLTSPLKIGLLRLWKLADTGSNDPVG
jgi:hypothetical protein